MCIKIIFPTCDGRATVCTTWVRRDSAAMVNIVLTPCPLAGVTRTSPGDGGGLDHTQLGQDSDIAGLDD